jgi:hypothetical protein
MIKSAEFSTDLIVFAPAAMVLAIGDIGGVRPHARPAPVNAARFVSRRTRSLGLA